MVTILSLKNKLLFLVLLISTVSMAADENEIKRHSLNLKQKQDLIVAITTKITSLRSKETSLEQELRMLEINIGNDAKIIEGQEINIEQFQLKLITLQKQLKPLQVKLDQQKIDLAKHIKLAYFMGRQDLMRILFNHLGNKRLAKSLSLHQYIRNKQLEALNAYLRAFNKLENIKQDIQTKNDNMQKTLDEKIQTKDKLKQKVTQRSTLLERLRTQLKDQEFSLQKRTTEANDLKDLIKKLEVSIGSLPIIVQPTRQFSTLKGRLPKPVNSKQTGRISDIKGVLFKATRGAKVLAIASGRVIFADWLRGYGLLIIIDHGDNYMSLYGKNQSLYRTKGEWVQAGDLLARVGDTGGANKSGLYFDIRLKGKSVAVLDWF